MRERDPNLLAAIGRVGKPVNESSNPDSEIHNTLRQYHLHNTIAAAAEDLNDSKTAEHHWRQASMAHTHAQNLYKNHYPSDTAAEYSQRNDSQQTPSKNSFTDRKRLAREEATKTIADKLA